MAVVVFEPVVESPLTNVLHGLRHADGDQFTDGEDGLAVVGSLGSAAGGSSILQDSSVMKSAMFMGFLPAECCQLADCRNPMTFPTFSKTGTSGE